MHLFAKTRSAVSLRSEGVVVVEQPPQTEVRHIFNGKVQDSGHAHIDECNWNPFVQLEHDGFFRTYITQTRGTYTITVQLPEYISRYIRVQQGGRVLAVVAKAVARRQWHDAHEQRTNVHEQWKTYWRLFRVPVQCDLRKVRALYGESAMTILVPRRNGWAYRMANWVEQRVWNGRRLAT
ncbi:hypothetical protein H4S02_003072 [Coemansia sp. RSA 2611]|nr:hypothetical protein IWW54_005557 [Coemansia sp. RSA 2705]KAJ2321247.1 hypothetical protein IWW52_000864 [Coemansia sp. RSA 2704]KAJ2367262.1 hypothetical protein H4S01_002253 [Coemansia sp. RSA 2610]KAJ2388030.1 hypothetical protein H4S02_003072 [Coemansia sp. RSA 2611]KAJ2738961.1 30 kDa heat shock protein [Coemansia sp. Cherry 401B]